jgi:hypothetical protein
MSCFPNRVYNGLEDLAETIMNHANCHSYIVTMPVKHNSYFATPDPVYVYQDIKPNLVGDSYMRLLTPLRFPSATGYHRFNYLMYNLIIIIYKLDSDSSIYKDW